MKENRIAIGQGRPEIHRFEVRCFEQKLDKLSRYFEVRCQKSSQKIAFNSRFIELFTFKRCFDTCSKVIRIEKVTESYFLFASCVNVHLLSDFLRKYFGLIRRVTKSVTICQPTPSSSSKRFRTRNRTQIVKNLNFLGLPKSNYSLTV